MNRFAIVMVGSLVGGLLVSALMRHGDPPKHCHDQAGTKGHGDDIVCPHPDHRLETAPLDAVTVGQYSYRCICPHAALDGGTQ